MTIYTHNPKHSVMANTSLPRAPDSPFSQAPTEVASTADPADDVNRPVPGWPTLAHIISQRPDLEAFASFADLHIKSLLYYQAELIHLRKALHEVEWADYRKSDDDDDSSLFAENLGFLIEARDESIEQKKAPPQQWVLIEKIRVTLEKYSKLLSRWSEKTPLTCYSKRCCPVASLKFNSPSGGRQWQCQILKRLCEIGCQGPFDPRRCWSFHLGGSQPDVT